MQEGFDPTQPIYLQLQRRVCRQIVRGELHGGEKLPSVRDMAVLVGVNPNTVQRVYAELERGGIVTVRRGEGTFVTEDPSRLQQLRDQLQNHQVTAFVADMQEMGFTIPEILEGVRAYLEHSKEKRAV